MINDIMVGAGLLLVGFITIGLIMENGREIRRYIFANKKCPTCQRKTKTLKPQPQETK